MIEERASHKDSQTTTSDNTVMLLMAEVNCFYNEGRILLWSQRRHGKESWNRQGIFLFRGKWKSFSFQAKCLLRKRILKVKLWTRKVNCKHLFYLFYRSVILLMKLLQFRNLPKHLESVSESMAEGHRGAGRRYDTGSPGGIWVLYHNGVLMT